MFYEDGNAFNMFVGSLGYTLCVVVRNTEWKLNFCLQAGPLNLCAHQAVFLSCRRIIKAF